MTDLAPPNRPQSHDAARKYLLPATLRPRELLALPFYVVVCLLYVLAACLGFVADAIAGKPYSQNLFDWRIS